MLPLHSPLRTVRTSFLANGSSKWDSSLFWWLLRLNCSFMVMSLPMTVGLGCNNTRLSTTHLPPRCFSWAWWVCIPVSIVILVWQTGHFPCYLRWSRRSLGLMRACIFCSCRLSKYIFQTRSKGLALPLTFTCRLITTVWVWNKRTAFPSLWLSWNCH